MQKIELNYEIIQFMKRSLREQEGKFIPFTEIKEFHSNYSTLLLFMPLPKYFRHLTHPTEIEVFNFILNTEDMHELYRSKIRPEPQPWTYIDKLPLKCQLGIKSI